MKRLTSDKTVLYYDATSQPVMEVEEGETFVVETHDMYKEAPAHSPSWEAVSHTHKNGVTGPIFVRGARPESVLRIDLLDVVPAGDSGAIIMKPGRGLFEEGIPTGFTQRRVKIEDGHVQFNSEILLAVSPMLGKIGVAPSGEPVHCSTPGPHGGNMDNRMVGPGATVYLPVFVDGALLSLGDAHAAMGDGESALSGVEIAAEAQLRCRVIEDLAISNPLVVIENTVATVASGATMEEAAKLALTDMAKLLADRQNLSLQEAAMLISVAANVAVCQIVNPVVTMRVEIDREFLPVEPLDRPAPPDVD